MTTAPTHKESTMTDLHAVFATDGEAKVYRVSDPLDWAAAHAEWKRLDDLRLAGQLPQTRYFEVRSVTLGPDRALIGPEILSHGRYDRAPLNLGLTNIVVKGRGYAKPEDAARVAWKQFAPTFPSWYDRRRGAGERTGVQGNGGWFYYSNGRTAAQGLRGLARLCKQRGLIVEGTNGRWYAAASVEL